jgi:hypothetical protein
VQNKVNAVFGKEAQISWKFSGKEIAVSAIGVGAWILIFWALSLPQVLI